MSSDVGVASSCHLLVSLAAALAALACSCITLSSQGSPACCVVCGMFGLPDRPLGLEPLPNSLQQILPHLPLVLV